MRRCTGFLILSDPSRLCDLFPAGANRLVLLLRQGTMRDMLGILHPTLRIGSAYDSCSDFLRTEGKPKGDTNRSIHIALKKLVAQLLQPLPVGNFVLALRTFRVMPDYVGNGPLHNHTDLFCRCDRKGKVKALLV